MRLRQRCDLIQSGVLEEVIIHSPSAAEQFGQSLLSQQPIQIPIAEYASRIAPTEFAAKLTNHLRLDAEGVSRAEANQAIDKLAENINQWIEENPIQKSHIDESTNPSSSTVALNSGNDSGSTVIERSPVSEDMPTPSTLSENGFIESGELLKSIQEDALNTPKQSLSEPSVSDAIENSLLFSDADASWV